MSLDKKLCIFLQILSLEVAPQTDCAILWVRKSVQPCGLHYHVELVIAIIRQSHVSTENSKHARLGEYNFAIMISSEN